MIRCSFSDFGKTIQKYHESYLKIGRQSMYQTLEQLAEGSRNQIIKLYPRKFKDENGVHKNQGVPKMITKSKVNKEEKSITMWWAHNRDIDFMDDQEFGNPARTGKDGASKALPTWKAQQEGRTNTGRMKANYNIKQLMAKIMSYENKRSKELGKPKPFIMTAKSGHHMLARRQTKARDSYFIMYHFDQKVRIRKRWNVVETIDKYCVFNRERLFFQNIENNMKNLDTKFKSW